MSRVPRIGHTVCYIWAMQSKPASSRGTNVIIHKNLHALVSGLSLKLQNHLGWKRPLRSLSSTVDLVQVNINLVPKGHVYVIQIPPRVVVQLLPQPPVPMLHNPAGAEIFLNISPHSWGGEGVTEDIDVPCRAGTCPSCSYPLNCPSALPSGSPSSGNLPVHDCASTGAALFSVWGLHWLKTTCMAEIQSVCIYTSGS